MSYRIPKLDDTGKIAPEHVPDPAAIGAATPADLAGKQDKATLGADVAADATVRAAFESHALPAHAGSRTGRFDPVRSVYNLHAANSRRLRAALGSARAGTGLARLAFLGDSLTAGYGNTIGTDDPVTLLRGELTRRGYTTGELINYFKSLDDPRIQYDGGGYTIPFSDISAGFPASVTGTGTVLEIVTNTQSPPFDVSVDGGAATTFTPSNGLQGIQVWTISGLANAEHTATIAASADWVKIYAAGFRQTTGVVVQNAGMSGVSTAEMFAWQAWQDPDGQLSQPWTLFHPDNVEQDCVLIELGVNDQSEAIPVATFAANLDRLTEWAGQNGADVALVVSNSLADAYAAAIYDTADARDVPLLDLADRFGPSSVYDAAPHDLSSDGTHLTAAGNAVKARAWADLLGV